MLFNRLFELSQMLCQTTFISISQKKFVLCLKNILQPAICRQVGNVSNDFISRLENIVGAKNTNTSLAVREQYSTDESCHGPLPADVVVFAHSTEEVSRVAKLCYSSSVPMIPHGTGTGLEHGIGAFQGGVCVHLGQMTSVLKVNKEDFDVTVEPGVTWRNLNHHLRDTGLMFPVDPGADACLGGMASTGASGTNAVRYGTMKENVLNLEVVLADGSILHSAGPGRRSRKSSAGYNLTNLFVGSEGTLGFLTKVTLRLHAIPETMVSAVCSFPSVKNAVDTVIQTLQSSIPIARIEFLDDVAMDVTNKYSHLDYPVAPSLFLEFHGSEDEVKAQANNVEEIASANKGSNFIWAQDPETRNKLWKARHQLYYATLAQKPGSKCITTDVCVPISKLAEMIVETKKDIVASGILGSVIGHVGDGNFHTQLLYESQNKKQFKIVQDLEHKLSLYVTRDGPVLGHVGDGNFHTLLVFDLENKEEYQKAGVLGTKIAERALTLDGTCTGEHGIGMGKISLLEEEYGNIGIEAMRNIKQALDPKYLMNPGKIFKMPAGYI